LVAEQPEKFMAKSLIRTVDGIGIWVRSGYIQKVDWSRVLITILISAIVLLFGLYFSGNSNIVSLWCLIGIILSMIFIISIPFNLINVECYQIYSASESDDGIIISKTTDVKSDQIAICKAAQEIESRCHEIAAKRAELDRIAESCK